MSKLTPSVVTSIPTWLSNEVPNNAVTDLPARPAQDLGEASVSAVRGSMPAVSRHWVARPRAGTQDSRRSERIRRIQRNGSKGADSASSAFDSMRGTQLGPRGFMNAQTRGFILMDTKTEVRKATGALRRALSIEPAPAEATDVLETLKKEHDEVKTLLAELQTADTGAQRNRLVQQIKMALVPHTKAEEKVVYDRVIGLRDKDAQTDGHEGYLEHELASKTLQRLDSMGASTSAEHRAVAKVLKELVEHHIKEEESNVWSDVKKHFSEGDRYKMNVQFEAAKARVKIP